MPEFSISHKFRYDLNELHTKRKKNEITEEDFSIQRDALIAQEAKLQEAAGPLLIAKELQAVDSDVEASVERTFQEEEQEENERTMRERFARAAEKRRIEQEENAKQDAIERENKKRREERSLFRSTIDTYVNDLEEDTNRWQRLANWLQIISIVLTTATASMAGFDGIPRLAVVVVGFAAATLGAILSYLQLQDKVYSSRKALADLRLECQMYDHRIDEYKNREDDPESAYLLFSKKVTAIQAMHMLQEVELLNPKKKPASIATQEEKNDPQKQEEPHQEREQKQEPDKRDDRAK